MTVGPLEEWPELIGQFVELAHVHGGRTAFYQVRPDALRPYLDAGLKLLKLGEEACIELQNFSLEGPERGRLRYALKRGDRDGLMAEVVSSGGIPDLLPTLREVSDALLIRRQACEKSFSVRSLRSMLAILPPISDVGMPERSTGGLCDFHDDRSAYRSHCRRHAASAQPSPYAMQYLFIKLALHLKQEGFSRFSLGMAPLSRLSPKRMAGHWHYVGRLLWRFGEPLYSFRGLRNFKSKFDPDWQPRYLAATGSLGPFLALAVAFIHIVSISGAVKEHLLRWRMRLIDDSIVQRPAEFPGVFGCGCVGCGQRGALSIRSTACPIA